MKVHQILQSKGREVATVTADTSMEEAVGELGGRRIGALVVVDEGGGLVGILSERDVVRALSERGMALAGARVRDLMTAEVKTCKPTDAVNQVMGLMTQGRFRHVPVVEDGKLAGLISIGDVVKARMDELEHERQALESYIASG